MATSNETTPFAQEHQPSDAHCSPSVMSATLPPPKKPLHLLDLSAELRNLIWEYALKDVEDNVKIRIYGETNNEPKLREHKARMRAAHPDRPSKLALLLTCRQINSEASAMAYSRMSFVLEEMPDFGSEESMYYRRPNNREEASRRYRTQAFEKLVETFGYKKLHLITKLHAEDTHELSDLACYDSYIDRSERGLQVALITIAYVRRHGDMPEHETPLWKFDTHLDRPAQRLLCNITKVFVRPQMLNMLNVRYLQEGTSWLSAVLFEDTGRQEERILRVLSGLKEVVVTEPCEYDKQTSVVVGKKIFAAGLMKRIRGRKDWT